MLPGLARRVASNVLPDIEDRMTDAVRDVLGTDDPVEAERRIADPKVAAELRLRLAQIEAEAEAREAEADQKKRQADLDAFREQVKDIQSARQMLTDLSSQDSVFAWGPVIISVVVVLGFFLALVLLFYGELPAQDDQQQIAFFQILNIVIGALTAGFATVISFWLGSSQGSRNKDRASLLSQQLVSDMQRQATVSSENVIREQAKQTEQLIQKVTQPQPSAAPAPAGTPAARPKNSRQFHKCVDLILRHEGGFVEHPDDPGGATNFGITHKTLAAWREVDKCTRDEVRTLQIDEAKEIYRAQYWNALNCDNLPVGVDLVVFDFGVNAGVGRSSRMLQDVVAVEQDGQVGPITVGAANRVDPEFVITTFSDKRLAYYRQLRHWDTFGRGWTRRTTETRDAALEMLKD